MTNHQDYRNLAWIIWNDGYEAYFEYVSHDENPYKDSSPEYNEWEDGWDCAASDYDD